MAWSVRGSTSGTYNAASGAATVPGAALEGDLLVLLNVRSGNDLLPVTPAGWTSLGVVQASSLAAQVCIRVAQSGDAGAAVPLQWAASGRVSWAMVAYVGADSVDPTDVDLELVPFLTAAASTAHTTPATDPATSAGALGLDFVVTKTLNIEDNLVAPAGVTRDVVYYTASASSPHLAIGHEDVLLGVGDAAGNNTWTSDESSQFIVGSLILRAGAVAPPTPGSVQHIWPGAPKATSFVVNARTSGFTTPRLAVSTSPSMSAPSFVAVPSPGSDGYVSVSVTGRTPDTQYYVQLADTPEGGEEELVGPIGRMRTLQTAGVPVALRKVVLGGCVQTLTSIGTLALQHAVSWGGHWGFFNGDIFYNGNSEPTEAGWVAKYSAQLSGVPELGALVGAGLAAYEGRSDHDTTNVDNGDSNNSWLAVEQAAWRKVVPHGQLGATNCFDQQWPDGRVSYFLTDIRQAYRSPGLNTDGPTKTMLGAAQLARLLAWIDGTTAPFNVIITDSAWMGPTSAAASKPDAWWSYGYERQVIIDAIAARDDVHFELWHGDSHLIGYATAEDNAYGGFPVICAAPYSQDGGGVQTGQFTEFFNNGSADAQEYVQLTFTDDGTSITRTAQGFDAVSGTVKWTFETVVDTTPPERQLVDVWTGAAFTEHEVLGYGQSGILAPVEIVFPS